MRNKEQDKQYYLKNKDYFRKKNKEWRLKNKEHWKEYLLKNKEHICKVQKEWYAKNKEHIKQKQTTFMWEHSHKQLPETIPNKFKLNSSNIIKYSFNSQKCLNLASFISGVFCYNSY